jgi:hypothetical protein
LAHTCGHAVTAVDWSSPSERWIARSSCARVMPFSTPVIQFSGDEGFPLHGGVIAVFVDRKAATFVFERRLHVASLFVFHSQGLSFPARPDQLRAASTSCSGETTTWGYALASDVDPKSLAPPRREAGRALTSALPETRDKE